MLLPAVARVRKIEISKVQSRRKCTPLLINRNDFGRRLRPLVFGQIEEIIAFPDSAGRIVKRPGTVLKVKYLGEAKRRRTCTASGIQPSAGARWIRPCHGGPYVPQLVGDYSSAPAREKDRIWLRKHGTAWHGPPRCFPPGPQARATSRKARTQRPPTTSSRPRSNNESDWKLVRPS